jgi:hypothetical protein
MFSPRSTDAQAVFNAPDALEREHGRLSNLLAVKGGNVARKRDDSVLDPAINLMQCRIACPTQDSANLAKKRTVVFHGRRANSFLG